MFKKRQLIRVMKNGRNSGMKMKILIRSMYGNLKAKEEEERAEKVFQVKSIA